MKRESSDNLLIRLFHNTLYTLQGLKVTVKEEKSVVLIVLFALLVFGLGLFLQVSFQDYFILGICFIALFAVELLNTALENTVDLVTKKYHDLAKKAKDQGSAATGMMVLIILLVMAYLYYPYIFK